MHPVLGVVLQAHPDLPAPRRPLQHGAGEQVLGQATRQGAPGPSPHAAALCAELKGQCQFGYQNEQNFMLIPNLKTKLRKSAQMKIYFF